MALTDYLAAHYLNPSATSSSSGPKNPKKRKTKHIASPTSNLTIASDDDAAIPDAPNHHSDDDAPTIVHGPNGGLVAKKKAKWKRIGDPTPRSRDDADADAVIAEAEAERRRQQADEDDAPVVEADDDVRMASGAKAGLQSAKQVSRDLRKREEAERRRMEAEEDGNSKRGETIYRDASGRVVNVAMARAEARAKADEEALKEVERKQALRGDVQTRQQEERRERLDEMKTSGVGRGAGDEGMNEEMRQVERWGDPMKGLLASKAEKKEAVGVATGNSRKKTYKGPSEPNRYGILPGYRWDGVDRGNGFERKWFAARNERESRKALSYAWEMDE